MSKSSSSWASLSEITLMFCICCATVARAQPPQPQNVPPPPARADQFNDDSEAMKQGSHRAFMLLRRQSVIQCMDIVREAIGRKDFLAAVPLMERVLSEPNSFIPSGTSTEIAAHEEVIRLARQMPPELRRRLEEQRRATANRDWELARTKGLDDVVSFIQQYRDLPSVLEAWWWLGCHERDHSRPCFAAEAFRRMADHPNATVLQTTIGLILAEEMLLDANCRDEAKSMLERLVKVDADLELRIEGRSIRLGQWLTDQHRHLPLDTLNEASRSPDIFQERLRRPVTQPIWKNPFTLTLGASLAAQEQRQRDLGISPVPLHRPLIIGDLIVLRKLEGIYAFQLSTGVNQWIRGNAEFREMDGMGLFDRAENQAAVTDWAQRRTQADSIFGRMSTDGRRLFAIQEPDRIREFSVDRDPTRRGLHSGPRFNKLCAYSLSDGNTEWELGGNRAEADASYRDCFFLGCPLVLDDALYVIAQRETEVLLLAIEPKQGSLIWSLTLGNVLLPVAEDLQRSRVACPIVWEDGLLLASTGAGAVVAVDPILRTLKWGYRYPARTITANDLLQGQNPSELRQMKESWWDSWREPFLGTIRPVRTTPGANATSSLRTPNVLVFESPESDQLHAVGLPDGELLWRIPRNNGLFLAGFIHDRVLVVEGDFVRAHDLSNGHQLWRTGTGELSGPGTLTGSILVLPLLSGGTMLLNTWNGEVISTSTTSESPLGVLVEADGGWVAYSRQSLMRLPRLGQVRDDIEEELRKQPDNESLRVRAAFLDLQAGKSESARGRLDGLQSSPARELRRQALIDALREIAVHHSNEDRSELAKQLKDLAEDVDYKFAAAAAIGNSALTVVDYIAAVDALLDGLSADLDRPEGQIRTASVIVRKDRVLLGLIDEAYRRAKPSDLPILDDLFQSRVRDARQNKDRFALQDLFQQWRGLDWSRRLAVQEHEKVFRNRSFNQIELRLLDAAGSDDPGIAMKSLEKLASHLDRGRASRDAWSIRERIRREFPGDLKQEGTNQSSPQTSEPGRLDSATRRPRPAWPETDPTYERLDHRNFGVFTLIPMHAEPGSLAERLDVSISRNGNEILFHGELFSRSGQDENQDQRLALGPTLSSFRGFSGAILRHGWGIGRIVILLVGSELHAISPLDDRGEPNPRPLWANPIDLQVSVSDTRVVKGRPGVNDGESILVDQSNRQIGKIGPVRAGYFCFQRGTKLVAAETETGRQLWERLDLPADATVLGDDHCVYLWREGNLVEVLSCVDGRKIEDRVWSESPSHMVHQRGSLVWTAIPSDNTRIELTDLRTGRRIWDRTDSKNAKVCVLDDETLAVVTTDGQLTLLGARTGAPLCPALNVNADSLDRIIAWHDDERWYLALARQVRELQAVQSLRNRVIRGTLYAIDRGAPKILWQRELDDEPLALDQSRVSPILVQVWRVVPKDNGTAGEGILRVIDKRTGKVILEDRREDLQPYFLLNSDPQQGIVELRLARETIRFHFASDPPTDAIQKVRDK